MLFFLLWSLFSYLLSFILTLLHFRQRPEAVRADHRAPGHLLSRGLPHGVEPRPLQIRPLLGPVGGIKLTA